MAGWVVLLAACAGSDAIEIEHAWARATPPGADVAAVYFDLRNETATARRLVELWTDVAPRAEIHTVERAEGVVRMRKLAEPLGIEPGARVRLAPGGMHLMLMGLRRPLAPGEHVELRLRFDDGSEYAVDVPVRMSPP